MEQGLDLAGTKFRIHPSFRDSSLGSFPVEVNRPVALRVYRIAWEPASWVANILACLDFLLPKHWRIADRLGWNWHEANPAQAIWMHAASLGECKGLWALAQALRDSPTSFVLSTNTTTGLKFLSEQIKSCEEPYRWRALLAPLDHPHIVQRFLKHFQITTLLLFEVELWPHIILTTRKNEIPVFWVSARLTPNARQHYANFPGAMRNVLGALTWVQAQTGEEAKTLHDWGCRSVEVGGDLRGLHYLNASVPKKETRIWSGRNSVGFISLHAAELPYILSAIESLGKDAPLFVFPRKMKELTHFQKALEPLGFTLHSQHPENGLLIVDSFGKVTEFLEHCHTAVIGGSFTPRGGHNLWEPLAAGTSMVIGQHHWNQDYLIRKMEERGLLHISTGHLSVEILRKRVVDPGPACREFMEHEKKLLLASVHSLAANTRPALFL